MTVRVVHLGLGAFYRAFALPWFAQMANPWGVVGVSLRSADVRDALAARGFRYTAAEMTPDGITPRQIDVLQGVLVAPEDPQAVIDQITQPDVAILSLTVTEKGYCHDLATGHLQADHPDIVHDLSATLPRTAPGFVLRGLQARYVAGAPPISVMSCDNLPGNGAILRGVVLNMAARVDPDLAEWIAGHVTFPQTMVDRIVPQTTPADIDRVARITGVHDAGLVLHEPFRQWVIEDKFAGPRPALDSFGVQFVRDVAPFEDMKLRMLNGAHSSLAYLGYLAGYAHISEVVSDAAFQRFLHRLWQGEIIPVQTPPEGVSLPDYADALLQRFANPALQHRTWQIAMDGSQKLPQRLLATLQDRVDAGLTSPALLLSIAGWMRFVGGKDEAGQAIDVRDPMADKLRGLARSDDPVAGLLSVREIFDPALVRAIQTPLGDIYDGLCTHGAQAMVETLSHD